MNSLSIIIPALDEENFLGETLRVLTQAIHQLPANQAHLVQVVVVDNDSQDHTADIARSFGATIVQEPIRNIARARNAGACVAEGELLFFLDADTLVPADLLSRINAVMADPWCDGGAVDVEYSPSRLIIRLYLWTWRILGRLTGMAQGAAQFCRRDVFFRLRGYDETIYMGEDVDFYWRLSRFARRQRRHVRYITEVRVVPSARRFNRWPVWKVLLWTNPALIALLRRRQNVWSGWYKNTPR